ncbi:MAG: alpha/beta hydrolase [Deltaproteobacteria bacterium]|nr:alpha/beta hydrolase [Deltaproteobacteria bacterium]
MPYIEKANLKLYYEDVGEGEPILTNHGLCEDGTYWSKTGVTAKLAEEYRVISMDMRGHGRTMIDGEPFGYDAATMGNDFGLLADELGLERFHILSHATGGMAAVRYAMTTADRLISLMLTDTGSATAPEVPAEFGEIDPEEARKLHLAVSEAIKKSTADDWIAAVRADPGVFLFKMDEHPEREAMWKIYEGFVRRLDPVAVGTFMERFYADPNTMVEGLRQIKCPTLVLLGEFDLMFLKPSEVLAAQIPDVRHVVIEGIGHMTAIEDPGRTIQEITDFLRTVRETGKADTK